MEVWKLIALTLSSVSLCLSIPNIIISSIKLYEIKKLKKMITKTARQIDKANLSAEKIADKVLGNLKYYTANKETYEKR